jgi:hypothetical protein
LAAVSSLYDELTEHVLVQKDTMDTISDLTETAISHTQQGVGQLAVATQRTVDFRLMVLRRRAGEEARRRGGEEERRREGEEERRWRTSQLCHGTLNYLKVKGKHFTRRQRKTFCVCELFA